MINILFILLINCNILISQVISQTESERQYNDPNVVSSYSTVTKQIPQTLKSNFLPKSKNFNSLPDRRIDVTSFLINVKDTRENQIKTKKIHRRKSAQLAWLDPDNVSSESDHVNSTAKAMEYLMELNASANQRTKKISKKTSYLCSESFEDEEFFIRSSNYPFNYPAFTTCEYTIKRRNVTICGIIFTILRFDLGSPDDDPSETWTSCTGDKLLIGNQVLCGRLRKGTESFYRFTWPTLKITFSSGSGFGASGFLIKGRQTEHCLPEKPFPKALTSSVPCNRIISDTTFNLSSPSYPLEYPHEVECQYEVIQANWDICGLLLTPSKFLLEGASYCMFDYVEIQGKRLCGNRTSPEQLYYMFENDKINIRFRTDETVSTNGFFIEGKQVKCNDLEYFQPIHSPLSAVDTPRESKAEKDLHDLQDISHALSLLVKSGIRSDKHLPGREPKTLFDKDNPSPLVITSNSPINFDGDSEDVTTSHPNVFSNLDDNNAVRTPSLKLFPRPLGNNAEDSVLSGSCDEQHSARIFFLQSINYPELYPNNIQCTYYIKRASPDVCQLRLTLEDIAIEKPANASGHCLADYLDIAGYKICGKHTKNIMYVTFTGENVILRFKSDSRISDRGYLITVEQIDKECGGSGVKERKIEDVACDSNIRYDNFTIFSPGYPQFYPSNLYCTTTVYKASPDIKSLEVELQEFAVESSPQCEKDYLSIGKLRFCGHRNGNSYIIPFLGDNIPLTFVTNEENSATGFRIRVNQRTEHESTNITPKCGGIYYSSTITITSPQFPSNYDTDQHCIYTIVRNSPDVCQLQFKIIHFDVEASPGCRRDYLQLGLRRLCGKNFDNEIHNYHFKNEKFILVFHSDLQSSGKGFNIEVRQRSCQKRDNVNGLSNSIEEQIPSQLPEETLETRPLHRPNFHTPVTAPSNIKPSLFINNQNHLSNTEIDFPSTNKKNESCNCRFYGIENIHNNQNTFYRPQNSIYALKPKGCGRCKLYPISNPYAFKHSFYQVESAESVNAPQVIKSEDINKFKFRPITAPPPDQRVRQRFDQNLHESPNPGIYIYNDWPSPGNPTHLKFNNAPRFNSFLVNRHQSGRALTFPDESQLGKSASNNLNDETKDTKNSFRQSSVPKTNEEINESKLNQIDDSSVSASHTLATSAQNIRPKPNSLLPRSNSIPFGLPTPTSALLRSPPAFSPNSDEDNYPLRLEDETPNFDQSLKLCNRSFSMQSFEVKSPGYPGPFYIDMHCFYLIYRKDQSRCGVLLKVDMLDLPGPPPCLQTYLNISGRRFCGTKTNGMKIVVPFSPKSPIVIEFKSDMFLSGAGFSLSAEQIPCNFSFVSGQKVFPDDLLSQSTSAATSSVSTFAIKNNRIATSESQQKSLFPERRSDEITSSGRQNNFLRTNSESSIQSFARGYHTVPWSGVKGVRNPPYKRGLQLVRLRKANRGN